MIDIILTAVATWALTSLYYKRNVVFKTSQILEQRCHHCAKYFTVSSNDLRVDNLCFSCKAEFKSYV